MLKLTGKDIRGAYAMPPTPSKDGSGGWEVADSVDHDRSRSLVEKLVRSGVGGLALCGTTGECAALLWEEKREYIATAVETAKKRVPIFAGATALGTKEVIRQIRGLKEVGADGAFIGLPLWQTPTLENSVQYYADLGEAVPDMPIMIYANAYYFKTTFPTPFWKGIGEKASTVITTKTGDTTVENMVENFQAAGHRVNFIVLSGSAVKASQLLPGKITALWTTAPWPEPWVALIDAIQKQDEKRIGEIEADLKTTEGRRLPEMREQFAMYNAQSNRWNWNTSGYQDCGPSRRPYFDLPESFKKHIQEQNNSAATLALRKKYTKVEVR